MPKEAEEEETYYTTGGKHTGEQKKNTRGIRIYTVEE